MTLAALNNAHGWTLRASGGDNKTPDSLFEFLVSEWCVYVCAHKIEELRLNIDNSKARKLPFPPLAPINCFASRCLTTKELFNLCPKSLCLLGWKQAGTGSGCDQRSFLSHREGVRGTELCYSGGGKAAVHSGHQQEAWWLGEQQKGFSAREAIPTSGFLILCNDCIWQRRNGGKWVYFLHSSPRG